MFSNSRSISLESSPYFHSQPISPQQVQKIPDCIACPLVIAHNMEGPTLLPVQHFNPFKDAKIIRKALKVDLILFCKNIEFNFY